MVKLETIEIQKYLIQNNSEEYTIREISKIRNINYKSAYEAIKKLEEEGSVIVRKVGNTKLCQSAKVATETTIIAEMQRRNFFISKPTFKIIYEDLAKINESFIALLFGSYVKGTQTKNSDIDLLIISNNAEKIAQKINWIPKNIHTIPINFEEFLVMLRSKEFNVVNEAVKNNIIFLGIEEYYRFLKNAR